MEGLPTTTGHLLNGRLTYRQPETGFRSGIEPVLLAAAIPARQGEHVLEAGSGAGAALLCLAARVPGVTGIGLEIDPALAALANTNATANAMPGIGFHAADITASGHPGPFDHAFANPPYHPHSGTPSPCAPRATAKIAGSGTFPSWIGALSRRLRARGTLTLILPATAVPACLDALQSAGCGSPALMPLWPRAGRPAKLCLLQSVRGGRAAFRLFPGLVLHADTGFTEAAEAILRHALPLPFAPPD